MRNYQNQISTIEKANPLLLKELPCPVALSSRDRSFYLLNSAAKSLFGFSEDDLLSHPSIWAEQIHSDDREKFFKAQQELAIRENVARCDYRFFPKGVTEPIWIRDVSVLANREAFIPWNVISTFTEISDLQPRQSSDEKAANSTDILKPLFHDLQNRLQVMLMTLELANRGVVEMESDRLLQIVYALKYSVESAQKRLNSTKRQGSRAVIRS